MLVDEVVPLFDSIGRHQGFSEKRATPLSGTGNRPERLAWRGFRPIDGRERKAGAPKRGRSTMQHGGVQLGACANRAKE
jgi:hypothetical protein